MANLALDESSFGSCSVLPQYPGGGHGDPLRPEKRLMLAVLEGAVSDYQKYATAVTGRGRRLFADAAGWFESPASTQVFDFETICQALSVDPSFVRHGLERWCSARRREPRPMRKVLRFPFRRMNATRHTISAPA